MDKVFEGPVLKRKCRMTMKKRRVANIHNELRFCLVRALISEGGIEDERRTALKCKRTFLVSVCNFLCCGI